MRILILSHMYNNNMFPEMATFVNDQVKELRNIGCEVKVISPVPFSPFPLGVINKKWKMYKNIKKFDIVDGVEVYYPRQIMIPKAFLFEYSGKLYIYAIKSLVKKIYKNFPFDIVHCHVAFPDGYAGTYLKKVYQKPLITTIHGQDFQQTIYRSKVCKNNVKKVLEQSNRVITVSNKLKKIGMDLITNEQKFTTVFNGVDLEKVNKEGNDIKNKYHGKIVFLSVGNLLQTKGNDITLRAMRDIMNSYNNLHLILIGEGSEKEKLQQLTLDLNLDENVEFLGQLSHSMVMQYMNICDYFVLPSWNEGFGVVYLEAMAHGKVTFACKNEGIDGIIVNGENGILVEPKSEQSLADAIKNILEKQALRQKIEENACITAKELTWKNNALKTAAIYQAVIDECRDWNGGE